MLTIIGYAMVLTFMVLIMMRRLSPMVALITIPMLFATVAGFGGPEIGKMMMDGIITLAPTGVMLMFAILYFGIMIDAGLFDPVVKRILHRVGGDPLKVVMGSALLAALVSLDGDGSTTYMITIASMLPLYQRLGMNPLNLTCVTILASGVMNLTPWGGPLARAASALHVEPSDVFIPMLPTMAVGILAVFALAYLLGRRERQRLGVLTLAPAGHYSATTSPALQEYPGAGAVASENGAEGQPAKGSHSAHAKTIMIEDSALLPDEENAAALRRPHLLLFNAFLTGTLMLSLILHVLPLPVLFMLAFAIALLANYPKVEDQRARVADHAKNVIAVVALIFAAGIFTGILSGTGMVKAMSEGFLATIPAAWGPYLAPITALASMPFTFFVSNDAFYFGILPVVAEAASTHGISPTEMARASLIGQPIHLLSPLVPSTYLLVGLAGVEFGDHQRYTLKWAVLLCLVMMATALIFGVFPFVTR